VPLLSIRQYAKSRGLDPANVFRKIEKGIIPKECLVKIKGKAFAKLDVEKTDAFLRTRTDFSMPHAKPIPGPNPPGPVNTEDDDPDGLGAAIAANTEEPSPLQKKTPAVRKSKWTKEIVDGKEVKVQRVPDTGNDPFERFRSAKTDTETMRARKLELEVAEIEGRLLDAEEVRKRVVKLVSETRDALLNIPGKLSPILVGISDPVEMETTLLKELNSALESLSRFE
jgi:hypothetical protein